MLKTSDLRMREVINVLDGKRLGVISDIEIDLESGRIKSLIIPGGGKFLGLFGKDDDLVIPWEKIHKIGADVILVEANNFVEPKRNYE